MEVTTVADDLVVVHDGPTVYRYDGLTPSTTYTFNGVEVTTLARPNGALLGTFATVNDVHFGELECGRIDNDPKGPIQRSRPGEPPYPEIMNRGAVAEITALNPHHVFVKGDLTCFGSEEEFVAFENCYSQFGGKLHVIRGNHDSYLGQHRYDEDQWIEMPGICVALMDPCWLWDITNNGLRQRKPMDIEVRVTSVSTPTVVTHSIKLLPNIRTSSVIPQVTLIDIASDRWRVAFPQSKSVASKTSRARGLNTASMKVE